MDQYHSIDLFAGCGGLSLGLESAGFRPVMFSELDKDTRESFKSNVSHSSDLIEIGNVKELTDNNSKLLRHHLKNLKSKKINEIDLVCGGPPCQAYSGIGHRRSYNTDKKNQPIAKLYEDMANIITVVNPKLFLFENVRGLLNSRWTKEGDKGEIFEDVVKTFSSIKGYKIGWNLLHAKNYGVPQNRPRIFLVGVRKDLDFFTNYRLERTGQQSLTSRKYPSEKTPESLGRALEWGLLPKKKQLSHLDIVDVWGDLLDKYYVNGEKTDKYNHSISNDFQRAMRTKIDGKLMKKGSKLTEHEYSKHSPHIIEKFSYIITNQIFSKEDLPPKFKTNKFAQRLLPERWNKEGPSITATSLPDDFIHYSQPRTPTVREWARLQTFPDWTKFHGKRTTGGIRRAGDPTSGIFDREVPKYTQIGNAVPVNLAKEIGYHLIKFLG
ncbi:MAG: DNA cytosine methyltransferase [Candidatus Poseidoniales archaeon]